VPNELLNHRASAPAKSAFPGAKAQVIHDPDTARLKPCPDTKHLRGGL
jgi:hypothetical protein